MTLNSFAVVDQTTGQIVKDGFKSRNAAMDYINRQGDHGYFNYSVEDASWNVYDDSECEH